MVLLIANVISINAKSIMKENEKKYMEGHGRVDWKLYMGEFYKLLKNLKY